VLAAAGAEVELAACRADGLDKFVRISPELEASLSLCGIDVTDASSVRAEVVAAVEKLGLLAGVLSRRVTFSIGC
jgi:NADP-dependent 3-hydroxy acid dehydrogenase YdfG